MTSVIYSVAFPNVVSPNVVKELGVTLDESNVFVTVANGSMDGVLEKLNDVVVDLGGVILKVHFVVLDNLPFDVVIGYPTAA